MKITKILALAMAVIMIIALVGCGGSKRKPIALTLSTEDSEAILNAAGIRLPTAEEAAGAGTTVRWCAHYDVFQNYSEEEMVNTGAWTFIQKYGGSFSWDEIEYNSRWDSVAAMIMSGDPPDMFPGETAIFPNYAIKGVFQPVNQYIDYDDALWSGMKDYAYTYFNLGGNIFAAVIDASFGEVVPYNRRVIEEYGYDDPAELFANDEWTWDAFLEMCLDFNDPDADRYAVDGWYFGSAIMDSSGTTIVPLNPDTGEFYSNLDEPGLERAANVLYELARNECVYPWYSNGWACRNASTSGAGVKEGLCLFWIVGTWGLGNTITEEEAVWGDMHAEEVMFVPLPRDPLGDGKYYMPSSPNAYCIINGASNPEGAALVCYCERFKSMDPVVKAIDRKQLKQKLLWSEEMLDMNEICYELANSGSPIVSYNDGYGPQLASIVSYEGAFKSNAHGTSATASQTWAQLKETHKDRMEVFIEELNTRVKDYIARGGTFEEDLTE